MIEFKCVKLEQLVSTHDLKIAFPATVRLSHLTHNPLRSVAGKSKHTHTQIDQNKQTNTTHYTIDLDQWFSTFFNLRPPFGFMASETTPPTPSHEYNNE